MNLMEQNGHSSIYEDIGYIKAKVEKIDGIDARLINVEKKIARIMGWATGAGAFAGITIGFLKDFFQDKIMGK